jgi:hypothetical protein
MTGDDPPEKGMEPIVGANDPIENRSSLECNFDSSRPSAVAQGPEEPPPWALLLFAEMQRISADQATLQHKIDQLLARDVMSSGKDEGFAVSEMRRAVEEIGPDALKKLSVPHQHRAVLEKLGHSEWWAPPDGCSEGTYRTKVAYPMGLARRRNKV